MKSLSSTDQIILDSDKNHVLRNNGRILCKSNLWLFSCVWQTQLTPLLCSMGARGARCARANHCCPAETFPNNLGNSIVCPSTGKPTTRVDTRAGQSEETSGPPHTRGTVSARLTCARARVCVFSRASESNAVYMIKEEQFVLIRIGGFHSVRNKPTTS